MTDRTVLVVGAGSAIARDLTSRLTDKGTELLQWSRQDGFDAVVDVVNDDSLPELPESLGGLVYFPGSITLAPFPRLDMQTFRSDWEVNVGGFVRVLQHAIGSLQKAENASVVGVSTVAAGHGLGFHASIAAAKAGVEALMRTLAAEYAPRGVRFNCVAPSLTDTPLAAGLTDSDAKRKRMDDRHPLGRIGQPGDVAAAIDYLLSDDASWVTGHVLAVDGGYGICH